MVSFRLYEFISAITDKSVHEFEKKYRNLDVFLLDDVQYLQNKPGTQKELCILFDCLLLKNTQMIFTCNSTPSKLKGISPDFLSRISSGLCFVFPKYNSDEVHFILCQKLSAEKIELPDEMLNLIIQSLDTDVRTLEAIVAKIVCFKEITNTQISIENIQEFIKQLLGNKE